MKKIWLAIIAGAALVLTGCSMPTTQADETFVHKAGDITEGHEAKGCVPPATREINWGTGMGDDYYSYPSSQRVYDFTKSKKDGSDGDRFTVVSKDGQQLTVPGTVSFTLNTNCDVLQKFHDLIGNRYHAYMEDDQTGPGWNQVLDIYFRPAIDGALDRVAKKYTWNELRSDLAIKNEMNSEVNNELKRLVNQQISGDDDYFTGYSTLVLQPIAPQNLVEQVEATETSKAQAAATEAKAIADANAAKAAADAQIAQKTAELAVAKIEAEKQLTQIRSYGGAEAWIKWQAVQKGINPWQPSYSNQLVQP